ncbi:MAG: hypothetical protein ABS76_07860 [Pelagibacterium sp. SCN 64-44]|nr:MAG: hypothetical protein ABS76_07860 [Pelagibacterium sp. SCN 64-44]
MSQTVGWGDVLPQRERLLWHDHPASGVVIADFLTYRLLFGLVFTAFALFWTFAASWMGQSAGEADVFPFNLFPFFGVPFVLAGLYMMIGVPLWDAYERSRSSYALTNHAAYIATELFGRRKLTRYPVSDMNALELEDGALGTVWFKRDIQVHTTTRHTRNGSPRRQTYMSANRIGFKRISAARSVYGMIVRLMNERDETVST